MELKNLEDKVVPALVVALIYASITLFRDVDRSNVKIAQLDEQVKYLRGFLVQNHDDVLEVKATYLKKDEYYKDNIKSK